MTTLRQKMIDEMLRHGFAERTKSTYLATVRKLAKHFHRHAYATHQLEAGIPVHQLQHLLGHKDLHSTLHYVHWSPNLPQSIGVDLLSGGES